MTQNDKLEKAHKIYEKICDSLTHHEAAFDPHDEALAASLQVATEQYPAPVNIVFFVKDNHQIIQLLAQVPLKADSAKIRDFCYILNYINFHLVAGNFDYDFAENQIFFRMTQSFVDSTIGEEEIFSMLMLAYSTTLMYKDVLEKFNNCEANLDEVIAALQLH